MACCSRAIKAAAKAFAPPRAKAKPAPDPEEPVPVKTLETDEGVEQEKTRVVIKNRTRWGAVKTK